jgi:uncharacterized Fe-S cluster protein YjdI
MSDNSRKYSNDDITVYWKPSKCSHATTCFRELIEVFNPRNRPWINMNGASTESIIEVVNMCPTAALSYAFNKDIDQKSVNIIDDTRDEVTPENIQDYFRGDGGRAKISIMKDGPILVEGEFKIINDEGNELKSMIMTSFCRCGTSRSQPFCDGSHRKAGFQG